MLEGARVQVFFGACGRQSSVTMLEGAGVLHRPFLRSFRGVGIFSVARHVSAQQLRLWLCSLRELPFSMQKKPSSCATAFMASSSKTEHSAMADQTNCARRPLPEALLIFDTLGIRFVVENLPPGISCIIASYVGPHSRGRWNVLPRTDEPEDATTYLQITYIQFYDCREAYAQRIQTAVDQRPR